MLFYPEKKGMTLTGSVKVIGQDLIQVALNKTLMFADLNK